MAKHAQNAEPCQRLRASIDIYDQSIVATSWGDNGVAARKFITPEELARAIDNAGTSQQRWLTFEPGVAAVGIKGAAEIYLVCRPAKKTTIRFEVARKKLDITVHLPNLLAFLRREKGKWTQVEKVFCFRCRKMDKKTQLYVAPLPNIGLDGRTCMGEITSARNLKHFASLSAAEAFEEMFIQTAFTDHHLADPLTENAQKQFGNMMGAIRATKGKVAFKYLRKIGTFGDILKGEI